MITVTENTIIEVGKFYLVKCAVYVDYDGTYLGDIPIIGKLHKDKQFSVNEYHYHIDGRFIHTSKYWFLTINDEGKSNSVIPVNPKGNYKRVKSFVYKKMKCKRLTTGIIPFNSPVYWDWQKTMIGKSCAGKKCPHLGTIMHEHGDNLVCPLHNLVGCKETERIIA